MKKRKSFVGGVVNKTLGKDNFDSIIKMLKHDGCEVSHISFSSLKGFIFKIHVKNQQEQDIEFYGLDETTNVFNKPVDTLVVKMAILYTGESNKDGVLELDNYKGNRKEMDKFAVFKNEAIVQSEIYEKTLSKGQPICPALIDFSHFTNLDSSMPFLNMFEEKCIEDDEARSMILYIKSILSKVHDCQLGMITMESAVTFETFYDAYDSYGTINPATLEISGSNNIPPATLQIQLCNDVVVQIIRLLNECRIIHCDLHGENVMVKKTNSSPLHKIFIIDFGRILHIDKLTKREKELAQQYATDFFMTRSFFNLSSSAEPELSTTIRRDVTKFDKNYVKTLTQFIISVEYMYNKIEFIASARSTIRKLYIDNLERLTSYTAITEALNQYYNIDIVCSIEETTKYKTVKPTEQHDKDITRFETLCDRIEDLKDSPSKSPLIAREAPELVLKKDSVHNNTEKLGKLLESSTRLSRSARSSKSAKLSQRSNRGLKSAQSSQRSKRGSKSARNPSLSSTLSDKYITNKFDPALSDKYNFKYYNE